MKKIFFSLMAVMMAMAVSMGLLACSSDDDSNGNGGGDLVGVWKRVLKKTTYYEKNNSGEWVQKGEPEETSYEGRESDGFQFLSDNRAVEVDIEADGTIHADDEFFQYKIENGRLYLLELDQPDDGWEDLGPIDFSSNQFVLTTEKMRSSSLKEVKVKTYRKIS